MSQDSMLKSCMVMSPVTLQADEDFLSMLCASQRLVQILPKMVLYCECGMSKTIQTGDLIYLVLLTTTNYLACLVTRMKQRTCEVGLYLNALLDQEPNVFL